MTVYWSGGLTLEHQTWANEGPESRDSGTSSSSETGRFEARPEEGKDLPRTLARKILEEWKLVNPGRVSRFVSQRFAAEGNGAWLAGKYPELWRENAARSEVRPESRDSGTSSSFGTGRSEARRVSGVSMEQMLVAWHRKIQSAQEHITFVIHAGAWEHLSRDKAQLGEYEKILGWNMKARIVIWGYKRNEILEPDAFSKFQKNFGLGRVAWEAEVNPALISSGRLVFVDRLNSKDQKVQVPESLSGRAKAVKAAYFGKETGLAVLAALLPPEIIAELERLSGLDYLTLQAAPQLAALVRSALLLSAFASAA